MNSYGNFDGPSLQQLRSNWHWYLLLGIGLIVLGMLAIIFSYTATLFSVVYLGGFLTVIGIFEALQSLKMRFLGRFFMHAALAILYILVGGYVIMHPALSAVHLTLFLAIFFVISGFVKIFFALTYHPPHKGLLLINAICSVILGVLLWQQWPVSGMWAIGLFVGIDTLFTGWNWIALALYAKQLRK